MTCKKNCRVCGMCETCTEAAAARISSSLAAANQQLDEMRAELAKSEQVASSESKRAWNLSVQLDAMRAELKTERELTVRLAREQDEADAERDAMRAERDEWKGNVRAAERGNERLAKEHMNCSHWKVECEKARSELAALRQSTEADAKPVAWMIRSTKYRIGRWASADYEKVVADAVPVAPNWKQETVVPLYESPAPVAPVPGTSEVVAWCRLKDGVARHVVLDNIGACMTPLYAAPPAPVAPMPDAKPSAWVWYEADGRRHVYGSETIARASAQGATVHPLYRRPAPVAPVEFDPNVYVRPVAPVPGTSEVVAYESDSPVGSAMFYDKSEADRDARLNAGTVRSLYTAPTAPARTLVREWYEDANGDPMEPGVTRHPDGTKAKRVRRWKLGTRGRK